MANFINKYSNMSAYDADADKQYPNVSYLETEDVIVWGKPHDYSQDYLTFEALEDGTFSFENRGTGNDIQYSLDNGSTWTTLASETNTPTVTAGSKILWKAELTPRISFGIGYFSSSGRFNVEGNVMSLLYGDNFIGQTSLSGKRYAFFMLFYNCTKLVSAEKLSLPATTLANSDSCYEQMFYACTSLTTAPELPATTLASSCYVDMFYGCTSLTTAPQLPATTLANNCYRLMFKNCSGLTTAPVLPATTLTTYCYGSMFYGCTSLTTAPQLPATTLANSDSCYAKMFSYCEALTTAPALPATTLADWCYNGMFQGCTSLTTAPELPATTLADFCYEDMFYNCSGLTIAPELPAQTLAEQCYYTMFYNCTNLNYIKCLATDISATDCTAGWVSGVASSGTFVKTASMQSWVTDDSGIPSGWTVEDA